MTGLRHHVASVAGLAGGSAGAVLLAALFLPLIARIFPVEVLGHYYTFLAAVTVAGAAVTLRLEMAIVVAEPADRASVVAAALAAGGVLSLAIGAGWGLLLWLAPGHALPAGWTAGMVLPFAPIVFCAALALVAVQVLLAAGRYGVISRARLVQVLAANVFLVGVGWWWPTLEVLVASQAVTALVPVLAARDLLGRAPVRRGAQLLNAVRRYRDFVSLNFPANLLNVASLQLPTVLIAAWYGPAPAVFFAMANRLLDIPFATLSGAMSQVFYREASEQRRDGRPMLGWMRAMLGASLVLGVLIALACLLFAEPFVVFFLGEQWGAVAELVPLLLAWRVMQFVNQPVSTIFSVLRRQGVALALIALFFLPRLGLLGTGADFHDAVARYTVASALFYFCYTLVGYGLAARERRHA